MATAAPSTRLQSLPQQELQSSSVQSMLATLSNSAQSFLQPTPALHAASTYLAKKYLDPLAGSINDLQRAQQEENRRKRKRGEELTSAPEHELRLRQVYTEGFTADQLWEQARRVLDATTEAVTRALAHNAESSDDVFETPLKTDAVLDDDEVDDDFEPVDANLSGTDLLSESGDDGSQDKEKVDSDRLEQDGNTEEDDLEKSHDHQESGDEPGERLVEDPNGLNDGFFSIDDFNRQSKFLEQQDARGDPDDGAASDEEEVDWSTNPLATKALDTSNNSKPVNRAIPGGDEESHDDDDEEEGPTFGDPDAESVDEEDVKDLGDNDDVGGFGNTNHIEYADFFAPPARKKSRTTRMRALPKTQPQDRKGQENLEADTERAMADVRRDLFDDEISGSDASSDEDPKSIQPRQNLSTHEKQKLKIAAEIRKLEAENVAQRPWALSGEARAMDRPVNSLIEEDLDFERTGKPVPVITAEVTEGIEELIKRRILAKEFDELIRRHPDSVQQAAHLRRGKVELDDTKAQQGLAELYEEDHLRATDPNYVDKRDEKLKKEHTEIERLWKEISANLDTLSNWNYKPKPQQASINVIADVPTISMEDARPTAGGDIGGESMLAPQEMYAPGDEGKVQGEVMLKGGAAVAKGEMTREEKLRRRRREKERWKKSGASDATPKSKKMQERQGVMQDLKRGGVKVIGKRGDIKDVEGRKIKDVGIVRGGSALKL